MDTDSQRPIGSKSVVQSVHPQAQRSATVMALSCDGPSKPLRQHLFSCLLVAATLERLFFQVQRPVGCKSVVQSVHPQAQRSATSMALSCDGQAQRSATAMALSCSGQSNPLRQLFFSCVRVAATLEWLFF
jgi:hypothetical protein